MWLVFCDLTWAFAAWLLLQLPVPNVDDESEDEFEEDTDEDENDDNRLPKMGNESRRGGDAAVAPSTGGAATCDAPARICGSLLTLLTTCLAGLAGFEEPALPRLEISHLLLTLTPSLVLSLL